MLDESGGTVVPESKFKAVNITPLKIWESGHNRYCSKTESYQPCSVLLHVIFDFGSVALVQVLKWCIHLVHRNGQVGILLAWGIRQTLGCPLGHETFWWPIRPAGILVVSHMNDIQIGPPGVLLDHVLNNVVNGPPGWRTVDFYTGIWKLYLRNWIPNFGNCLYLLGNFRNLAKFVFFVHRKYSSSTSYEHPAIPVVRYLFLYYNYI